VFDGSGRSVRWRLPKGSTQTPVDVTISLTVIERYTEVVNSLVITREHRVTGAASPFRVHDSDAELRKISIEFLVYLFGNSSISPSACLVDFSDSCRGKQDELRDIEHNRNTFVILSAEATVGSVWISGDRLSAEVIAPCAFRDREIATGREGTSRGDCFLTAVYERDRWWLCSSSFLSGSRQISMRECFRLRSGTSSRQAPQSNTLPVPVPFTSRDVTTVPSSSRQEWAHLRPPFESRKRTSRPEADCRPG
jgi:hypothetical protein